MIFAFKFASDWLGNYHIYKEVPGHTKSKWVRCRTLEDHQEALRRLYVQANQS